MDLQILPGLNEIVQYFSKCYGEETCFEVSDYGSIKFNTGYISKFGK
jgi:hypothetical protein